jgi:WD40 repeat protein
VSSHSNSLVAANDLFCRLFRTLNLKVPLTSLEFSPEGSSIYVGTENGKLLILDLRSLDKPHKTIVISDAGYRIETMSVQVCSSCLYPVS